MSGEIAESDYQGRQWAVVRDVHGTRIGVRSIPRGHQVALMLVLTTDQDSDQIALFRGGENVQMDAAIETAVVGELTRAIAQRFGMETQVEVQGAEGTRYFHGFGSH